MSKEKHTVVVTEGDTGERKPSGFHTSSVLWIKDAMHATGWSIRRFAVAAKIDPTNLSRIIRGTRLIQPFTLWRLVDAVAKRRDSMIMFPSEAKSEAKKGKKLYASAVSQNAKPKSVRTKKKAKVLRRAKRAHGNKKAHRKTRKARK